MSLQRFVELYSVLDETTKTTAKVAALAAYFRQANPADAAWAVHLFSGRSLRQFVPVRRLRQWVEEHVGLAEWLFDECYEAVGDLAETISLLLPPSPGCLDLPLSVWMEQRLSALRSVDEEQQRAAVVGFWTDVRNDQHLVLHKLITGAFRVGVSQKLVVRGLADAAGLDREVIAHRLMGDWTPSAAFFARLIDSETSDANQSQPYPFFLAHPLESAPKALGEVDQWQVEWKWDGIRAQLIRRGGQSFIWSRGEELVTDRFPEVVASSQTLPDGVVLDGELLAWREGVLPFSVMQKRIGRKKLGKKILAEAPVVLMAFDLIEEAGEDIRQRPQAWRREQLESLLANASPSGEHLLISPRVNATSWRDLAELRQQSRQRRAEGLMLKRVDASYGVGRTRGAWWKWKVAPYTIDAVLIYAQRGSGKRAGLYTDYTFAVWHDGQLTPFAKAYSGLTNEEIAEVDAFVRGNTLDRFGPVRAVQPEMVFEIAFENIQASTRHKSGVAVRFPRIARWRRDKTPEQADTLSALWQLATPAKT